MKTSLIKLFKKSAWFLAFLLPIFYEIISIKIFNNKNNMDWINSIIQIILVLLLVFISKSFVSLDFKMTVFAEILKIRLRQNIVDNISGMTREEISKFFLSDLINEKKRVISFLRKNYPDKKGTEINKIIDEIYYEIKELEKQN